MNVARWLSAAVVLPAAFAFAAPAHADDQSYLDYLMAHGFRYHVSVKTPDQAVQFGKDVCAGLRFDGNPRSQLDPKTAGAVDRVMIDAAQHELCPDALPAP